MPHATGTRIILCLYGLFIVGAITLLMVSLTTTHWAEFKYKLHVTAHVGLFRGCYANGLCMNFADIENIGQTSYDDLEVIQGLTITATLMDALSLVLMGYLVLGLRMKVKDKKLGWIGMVVCIIASILAGSGVAHFINKVGISPLFGIFTWTFGYSLYLAVLSCAGSFGAGISFLGAVYQLWRKDNPPHPVVQGGPAVPVTYVYPNNQKHPIMVGNYEQPPPMYTVAIPTYPAYPYQQPPAGTYPAGAPPPMVDPPPYLLPPEKS